jgi:hypothetical protein
MAALFDAIYHPDEVAPDKVLWLDCPDDGLHPINEILSIITQGTGHPKYREVVERLRRHAI